MGPRWKLNIQEIDPRHSKSIWPLVEGWWTAMLKFIIFICFNFEFNRFIPFGLLFSSKSMF
jgi:hypothetical protein